MQPEISDLLTLQRDNLNHLMSLLAEELDAFKNRDPDLVEKIAQNKLTSLQNIEATDKKIALLPDLNRLKEDPDFSLGIEYIQQLLSQVKAQNQVNERVIRTSLGNLQRLKQGILALKNQDAMTYDKLGQAQSQMLGKGIKA